MASSEYTAFPYTLDLIMDGDAPSPLNQDLNKISSILKQMTLDKFMPLKQAVETKIKLVLEK